MTKARTVGTLKSAVATLVKRAGGVAAHTATRVSRGVLHSYADTDEKNAKRHMPIDVVIDLEREVGDPIVIRYAAFVQGYLLVRMPVASNEPYQLVLARITSETGQLLSAGAMSMRDGRMTVTEAHLVKAEAMEVAAACASLASDCDAVIAREGGDQ